MEHDHSTSTDKNQFSVFFRGLLTPKALIFLFILILLFVGIAWRQLDTSTIDQLKLPVAFIKQVTQLSPLSAEISEQLGESNGIILATVIIVMIVIGGTFGATRHKAS